MHVLGDAVDDGILGLDFARQFALLEDLVGTLGEVGQAVLGHHHFADQVHQAVDLLLAHLEHTMLRHAGRVVDAGHALADGLVEFRGVVGRRDGRPVCVCLAPRQQIDRRLRLRQGTQRVTLVRGIERAEQPAQGTAHGLHGAGRRRRVELQQGQLVGPQRGGAGLQRELRAVRRCGQRRDQRRRVPLHLLGHAAEVFVDEGRVGIGGQHDVQVGDRSPRTPARPPRARIRGRRRRCGAKVPGVVQASRQGSSPLKKQPGSGR